MSLKTTYPEQKMCALFLYETRKKVHEKLAAIVLNMLMEAKTLIDMKKLSLAILAFTSSVEP